MIKLKNIGILLLVGAMFVVGYISFNEGVTNKDIAKRLEQTNAKLAESTANIEAMRQELLDKIDANSRDISNLTIAFRTLQPKADHMTVSESKSPDEPDPRSQPKELDLSAINERIQNYDLISESTRLNVIARYKEFLDSLNLTLADKEKILAILVEAELKRGDLQASLLAGDVTLEDYQTQVENYSVDSILKSNLPSESYDKFSEYRENRMDRALLGSLEAQITSSIPSMSDNQRKYFTDTFSREMELAQEKAAELYDAKPDSDKSKLVLEQRKNALEVIRSQVIPVLDQTQQDAVNNVIDRRSLIIDQMIRRRTGGE